jgi:transcriptional regulator with XRE-family HTH domain
MERIEKSFGIVLRERREKLGLSQEAFADIAGIHRTYVSAIERGKVRVSIEIAEKLAIAVKTPLSVIWKQIERRRGSQQIA